MSDPAPTRLQVLLIADSAEERERLLTNLQAGGFDVEASHLETVDDLFGATGPSPDVIIVDIDPTGTDLRLALSGENSASFPAPVVVVGGPAEPDAVLEYASRGVAGWVDRHRLEDLAPAVRRTIERQQLRIQAARATEALRDSERRLARAQEVAHIGSWEWDVVNDRVVWSDELYRIYGQEPSRFSASYAGFIGCVHPDDRARVESILGNVYVSGEAFEFDHRVIRPDGSLRTAYCRGEVERDTDGRILRMSGIAQDVTEDREREMELAEALRRLGEARALARVGDWELDLKTGRFEWSAELYELYGVDPATFTPTVDTLCELLSPEEAAELRANIARARVTGQGWENDIRATMPDGTIRTLHGRAVVEVDEQGVPVRIQGTRQDVTALRAREMQLREAEERFRLAFDEAPIGLAVISPDGHFLRVNHALCDIVGYTPDELLERRFSDITHPDDVDSDWEYVARLLDGEIVTNEIEKRYFHADGHVVWIQLNVSLARDESGQPLYFITQVQDVTGRRETEQKLRASEGKFRGFLESAPDAMVIVSSDGNIVLVNRQTEQMFGYTRDELIGQPVETLIPPQFRHRHGAHRTAFFGSPQARPMGAGLELFGLRSDGTEFPVEISLSPLQTDEGLLVSSAIRDITERKRAESIVLNTLKRERELTDSLRQLDRIKSDFVATVSHELRTPLTNIIGTIELLAEGDFGALNPQQSRIVEVLERNSSRLLELIKDLLDLNQIETGGLTLHPAPTDLHELVDRIRALVQQAADTKGVTLTFDLDRALGTAEVDSHQLERALVNLATNAIKFTPAGGEVTVRAEQSAHRAIVVMRDTGIGIPDEDKPHLFTRFFRSSIATQKAIPGSGLGLVIVKSIVEGHGGSIEIDSRLGHGTTVTVSLPLRQPAEPAEPLTPAVI